MFVFCLPFWGSNYTPLKLEFLIFKRSICTSNIKVYIRRYSESVRTETNQTEVAMLRIQDFLMVSVLEINSEPYSQGLAVSI